MIVALFDSDGTLFSNQQGWGMLKYLETHGRRGRARAYLAWLLPAYLLNKAGLMPRERSQLLITRRLSWLVRGMRVGEGAELFAWVANEYLLPSKRPDAERRLQAHRKQGHMILIASAMFLPCLELIGRHFGVENLVGTRLEVKEGLYTGSIVPPLISGPAKAEQAQRFLASRNSAIDWEASFAYGDSFTDRDMLALAGHPVAVYPDPKLHALAQERGWEVLGTPKA